jgi:glutathione S-transferase
MLWQGEDGEPFGDGDLEPGGQLWRLVAIGFDQGFQLGFGGGEVLGVPDLAHLAADALGPLFRSNATEDEKAAAHIAVAAKFDRVEAQFSDGRTWMVADRFSVADAYLFAVANWANFTGIDLARWPSLAAFVARVANRPAAQNAMKAEGLIQ